ncbi:MAG: hypothetical protein OEP95_05615 [Myxococcales bacterium]|nr:hypothetical protein [Myxococcales bacterium]
MSAWVSREAGKSAFTDAATAALEARAESLAKPLLAHRVTRCVARTQVERMRVVLERAAAAL